MRMKKTPKLLKFNLVWASPKDKVMRESKITNLYLLMLILKLKHFSRTPHQSFKSQMR